MVEQLPLWNEFFSSLGFKVIISDISNREIYRKGQNSIPSDTVCYPAKLVHGHIETLIEKGCDAIFYPCMTYNVDEKKGDNCYNCPVVAYYPELIEANQKNLRNTRLIKPYLELNSRIKLKTQLLRELKEFRGVSRMRISRASDILNMLTKTGLR